jgi:hypothetical protein
MSYRQATGINYSALADFSQSQDHALLKKDDKAAFQLGHAFESILRGDFEKNYAVSDFNIPDEIYAAVKKNENLDDYEILTKSGERHKKYASRHAAIDFFKSHPGKKIISEVDRNILRIMAKNLLKAEYRGVKIKDILSRAKWNTPIFWDDKKAELDCYIELRDEILLFDIKTAASFGQFRQMLKSRYWIQDHHYSEGCEEYFGKQCKKMVFFVATKERPYLAQAISIDDESREYGRMKYLELCERYRDWVADGKPEKGWLEAEEVKVFIK